MTFQAVKIAGWKAFSFSSLPLLGRHQFAVHQLASCSDPRSAAECEHKFSPELLFLMTDPDLPNES